MSQYYNDALQLEVSILEALLQRNRCSQSKAKYFQRTNMVLRGLRRSRIMELMDSSSSGGSSSSGMDIDAWKQGITDRISSAMESSNTNTNSNKRPRGKPEETELWDRASLQNDAKQGQQPLLDKEATETLHLLQTTVQSSIPELVSRIQFASTPLFLEISRGFFLPFCTMAVAALARIRVLLMRFGHAVLDAVQDVQQQALSQTVTNDNNNNLLQQQLGFFLSPQAMVECRTMLTDVSELLPSSSSIVQKEKMRLLKQCIGFTTVTMDVDKNNNKNKKESDKPARDTSVGDDDDNDNDETGIEERENTTVVVHDDDGSDSSMEDDDPNRKSTSNSDKATTSSMEDDDIGEAVVSSGIPEDVEAFAVPATAQQPLKRKATAPSSAAAAAAAAASIRLNKKDKAVLKKRKKTSTSNEAVAAQKKKRSASPTESSGNKKEKKKQRKKHNFFDNLFD